MTPHALKTVINDIEENLEESLGGDAYMLTIQLTTGLIYSGPCHFFTDHKGRIHLLSVDTGDKPPIWIAVEHIMTVTITN